MVHCTRFPALLLLAAACLLTGCATTTPTDTPHASAGDDHARFFANLAALHGQSFRGETTFIDVQDSSLADAPLSIHVEPPDDDTLRIGFHVGDDRSRTWVLTLTPGGLHLRHDHRDPDGSPHDTTDYGGWATATGTALRQNFPADAYTREILPEAATNVWTIELNTIDHTFVYDLTRYGRPRYRAIFDLSDPLDPDA